MEDLLISHVSSPHPQAYMEDLLISHMAENVGLPGLPMADDGLLLPY